MTAFLYIVFAWQLLGALASIASYASDAKTGAGKNDMVWWQFAYVLIKVGIAAWALGLALAR